VSGTRLARGSQAIDINDMAFSQAMTIASHAFALATLLLAAPQE
jgi:hypothetical protein